MTTITHWQGLKRRKQPNYRKAYTLVEVLIASGLAGFILAAVLSAFGFLTKSGMILQNYNDIEKQSRTALEFFAQDTRQAGTITWNSTNEVVLTVDGANVTYRFNLTDKTFERMKGAATQKLISGVSAFAFKAFSITGSALPLTPDSTELVNTSKNTKQIQISLTTERSAMALARASNTVLSARYVLRNKKVTN